MSREEGRGVPYDSAVPYDSVSASVFTGSMPSWNSGVSLTTRWMPRADQPQWGLHPPLTSTSWQTHHQGWCLYSPRPHRLGEGLWGQVGLGKIGLPWTLLFLVFRVMVQECSEVFPFPWDAKGHRNQPLCLAPSQPLSKDSKDLLREKRCSFSLSSRQANVGDGIDREKGLKIKLHGI